MGRNKRRKIEREYHCGPTCRYCQDPGWFKLDEEEEEDYEFGPDEWGYDSFGNPSDEI